MKIISKKFLKNQSYNSQYKTDISYMGEGLEFDHYLAGSGIGFSITILLILAIMWIIEGTGIDIQGLVKIIINIIPTIIGGIIGSYLLISRRSTNCFYDGIKIGLGCFIITLIYTTFIGTGNVSIYLLIGFVFGGLIGGLIAKKDKN